MLVVALAIVPVADGARGARAVTSGVRGFSHAKAFPRHGYDQFRFTAAGGEHVRLTVATRVCNIPFPGIPGSCVILTDAGSRIGYAYHVKHYLGSTQFEYGCLNLSSERPGHEAVCPTSPPTIC